MTGIDVFISYSTKNADAAKAVCHALEEYGIRCWIAPRDIPPGYHYGDMIDTAIMSAKVFLLVYSKDSLDSQWCNGELNVAFSEGKTIVPYRIEPAPLKGAMKVILSQTHWIDSYPDYKDRFEDLGQAIGHMVGKEIPVKDVPDQNVPVKEEKPLHVQNDNSGKLTSKEWLLVGLCFVFGFWGFLITFILYITNIVNRKRGKSDVVRAKVILYMLVGSVAANLLLFIIGVLIG